MQSLDVAMIILETANGFCSCSRDGAEPRKQRLFFIRRVPLPTHTKIVKRSLDRAPFLIREISALGSLRHDAEDSQKAFNSSMAVFEHDERIIKSAVGPGTNLYRHILILSVPCCYAC